MTLDVMLVTTAARVDSIPELPAVEGVHYIVCVQDPAYGLEPEKLVRLNRRDVDLRIYHDSGLSVNRNHALEAVSADVVLVADDDLVFHPDGLRKLMQAFDDDVSLDFATFKASVPESRIYPPDGWNLSRTYRFYSPISFEMAFRRKALLPGMIFSTLAGIGAPYLGAGEDDLFFYKVRTAGLNGRFLDIPVVTHPGNTTSVRSAASLPVVRAKGALMRIVRGFVPGLIRIPLEAYRSPLPFLKALNELTKGFVYATIHRSRL